ncbi:MAG: hypothetical protein ACR2O2_17960 [Ruegeria sp.]
MKRRHLARLPILVRHRRVRTVNQTTVPHLGVGAILAAAHLRGVGHLLPARHRELRPDPEITHVWRL